MTYSEYKFLILSDLYRITGTVRFLTFFKCVMIYDLYKYNFWMRTCTYLKTKSLSKYAIYPLARFKLQSLSYKLGISVPPSTQIGSGFFIGHFGGVIVNEHSIIGKNCNISQDVTLGQANRGPRKGCPILGDNVYIGPGAKLVGAVKIGNNVAIGANCVVTKDIPDNAVVVGIPGQIISDKGASGYINKTDYHDKIN